MKDIHKKIEESRNILYKICPHQKEKLLKESRRLDLLIVEYHRYILGNTKKSEN